MTTIIITIISAKGATKKDRAIARPWFHLQMMGEVISVSRWLSGAAH